MATRLVLGLVAAAVVAGLVIAELATSGSDQGTKPAPALPAHVLHGPKVSVASLRGQPALINFWASWCEPCRQEAPGLERLSRKLRGSARLVGVDFNDDSTANADDFIREHRLTYPIVRDADGIAAGHYGVSGLPTTFVLDADGRIVRTLRGPQTAAMLREALSAASSESG